MRIEVDEDPLVGTRRRYHPCASLRRGIRHGVSWRGEVAGRRDSDVASTFICRTSDNSNGDVFTPLCTIHKVNIIVIASIFTESPIVNFPNQNNLPGIKTPVLLCSLGDIFIHIKSGGRMLNIPYYCKTTRDIIVINSILL